MSWQQQSYPVSGAGPHTLQWRYVKDASKAGGSDCGWVDYVQWSGSTPPVYTPIPDDWDTVTYTYDALGSVVALSDANGDTAEVYEYSVYGQVASSDPNHVNLFMFTGREFDKETGPYCYRARYYHPEIGRFLQTDPVSYQAGMKLYRYCRNNPLNMVDPYGLFPWGNEWNVYACLAYSGWMAVKGEFNPLDKDWLDIVKELSEEVVGELLAHAKACYKGKKLTECTRRCRDEKFIRGRDTGDPDTDGHGHEVAWDPWTDGYGDEPSPEDAEPEGDGDEEQPCGLPPPSTPIPFILVFIALLTVKWAQLALKRWDT